MSSAAPVRLPLGRAGVLVPARVEGGRLPVRIRRPHDLRHGVRERPVAALALAFERRERLLAEQRLAAAQLDRPLPQVDEDRDLRPEDLRVERLHQVVHGARLVAPEDVLGVLGDRRQEEDRDGARPLSLLDQLGGLEAVEPGHLDVQQDRREVVVEEVAERLLARVRADELRPERLQDRLERQQVLGPVVDEQDLRAVSVTVIGSTARTGSARSRRAGGSRRRGRPRSPPPASPASRPCAGPARSRRRRAA